MTQNVFNCCSTVHYRVTVCGVTSLAFSVHGDESGVERLSHISTAMAVHFLLIYKYIQMLFFPIPKMTFYSDALYNISQQLSSKHTVDILQHKPIKSLKPVTTVYLDADIAIFVFAKLLQDSNKTVKLISWCDLSFLFVYACMVCMCVLWKLYHETEARKRTLKKCAVWSGWIRNSCIWWLGRIMSQKT